MELMITDANFDDNEILNIDSFYFTAVTVLGVGVTPAFDSANITFAKNEEMLNYINEKNICCPDSGAHNFTDIRQFNLMFKTFQGGTEDSNNELYLRPETAQGILVNFANIQRTTRRKVPFGVAQSGKSFRN